MKNQKLKKSLKSPYFENEGLNQYGPEGKNVLQMDPTYPLKISDQLDQL